MARKVSGPSRAGGDPVMWAAVGVVAGVAGGWWGGMRSACGAGTCMPEPERVTISRETSTSWKVEIKDEHGKVIKTFSGTGAPPKTVSWDGKTRAVPEIRE